MLRVVFSQTSKTSVSQHIRSFATPTSKLASNTAPGPFPTDAAPNTAGDPQDSGDGITNNYWDKAPKVKKQERAVGKDAGNKPPVRKGVMQNLFF